MHFIPQNIDEVARQKETDDISLMGDTEFFLQYWVTAQCHTDLLLRENSPKSPKQHRALSLLTSNDQSSQSS